jgi:hypothetical protein
MSNITIEGIAQVIKTELDPVNTKLSSMEGTLAQHTKTLDTHTKALDILLTASKNKTDANTVSSDRFSRLERWAEQVGQKLGIKLEL